MTKQEQIEKMAKIDCATCAPHSCCPLTANLRPCVAAVEYAAALYNAGYREADEVRKETIKEILQCLYDECYEAQNIRGGGIAHILPIDILQLAKQYGVEVEE